MTPSWTPSGDADLGNAVLPQLVLAQLMESGELERQLRFAAPPPPPPPGRDDRRASAPHLPGARVHGAAAGLHLMITFDAGFADTDARRGGAGARREGAAAVLAQPARRSRPGLVLGYAASTPSDIAEGIATLGAALSRLTT